MLVNPEKLEEIVNEIRKENPENKIFFTYGAGNKIQLDGELKIDDGVLTVVNINDNTIRYIDVESVYEVVLNND